MLPERQNMGQKTLKAMLLLCAQCFEHTVITCLQHLLHLDYGGWTV